MECKELRQVHLDFFSCSELSEATAISSDQVLTECKELKHLHLDFYNTKVSDASAIGKGIMECKEL